MFEEKLNIIIELTELQNRSSPEFDKPGRDTDLVKITFNELHLLAGIFADIFPEEVKLFADGLSGSLNDFRNTEMTITEKNEKEAEIINFLEANKNSIAYLNSFNRILIAKEYDRNLLEELNRSHNFSLPPDQDYSSRDLYFKKLAENYVQGNASSTIQYLLKTRNDTFLESAGFMEDVKEAVTITERERLKKKMQSLDESEEFDIPEHEIKAAITISERERLKEVLRKIDAEEKENKVKHLSFDSLLPSTKISESRAKVISLEKSKFNWKRYAVAASIIAVISITTIIVINNRKTSSGIARNNPDTSDTTKNKPDRDHNINEALASNKWESAEMVLTVKKKGAMGFAVKPEKITAKIYRLKENISGLPEVERQIDSLKKMNKTYTFENNNLSVYLVNDDLPVLYKIENKYYLKIADTLYNIGPSGKPAMLKKVTDRNILTGIDKINYQQDIK